MAAVCPFIGGHLELTLFQIEFQMILEKKKNCNVHALQSRQKFNCYLITTVITCNHDFSTWYFSNIGPFMIIAPSSAPPNATIRTLQLAHII